MLERLRAVWFAGLLATAVCPVAIRAQETSAAAPAERRGADRRDTWTFPFTFSNGKIFVDVKVNGRGPYPFAIDTGSPPTIIDTHLAEELGLPVRPMGEVGGAGEGSTAMAQVEGVGLEFGGITMPPRRMMGVAINQRLSGYSGRPVMGLIGNDFVGTRLVEVDYAARTVTVRDAKEWEYTGTGTVVPARRSGYTFVRGRVTPAGGEPIPTRFMIDTGAGLGASLTTPFVNKHNLLDAVGATIQATVGYGLGGEVRHSVGRLGSLELGKVEIGAPVVTLSQDKAGALAASSFDGIIGGEILSRYTVIFDLPRGRMILEPNKRAGEPLEFDMSGLTLAGDGDGGRLRVMRVEDGSPAAAAGVREDDILMAIDGRKYWAEDRDEARARLKGDGEERELRLLRDGEVVEVRVGLKRRV